MHIDLFTRAREAAIGRLPLKLKGQPTMRINATHIITTIKKLVSQLNQNKKAEMAMHTLEELEAFKRDAIENKKKHY